MLQLLIRGIKGIWYSCWGRLFAILFYDKRFLTGRWFEGKCKGLCAKGWEWITRDVIYRITKTNTTKARVPVGFNCHILMPENIIFDPDDLNVFQTFGTYFQAIGKITIGKGTYIGPNCGLITANHDLSDLNRHQDPADIVIGKNCWIGMNSVVLPGVVLGDNTIVGAGSVVTHSFPEGFCIIAGTPAKTIKNRPTPNTI